MAINITSGESLIGRAFKKKHADDFYVLVVGVVLNLVPEGLTEYSDVGLDLFFVGIELNNKDKTFILDKKSVGKLLNKSYYAEDESRTLQYKLLYEKNKNEEKWWIE